MPLAHAQPNFSGNWQLNIGKSAMRGPAPRQTLMEIEHAEPKLVQRVLVTYDDGTENSLVFHYDTGNETANAAGGGEARCRAHWEGPEFVIESWLNAKDRELHFRDYWSISDDGNTLTMAHKDDDLAGQISVLEKAPQEVGGRIKEDLLRW